MQKKYTVLTLVVGLMLGGFVGYKISERQALAHQWNLGLLSAIGGGISNIKTLELLESGKTTEAKAYLEGQLGIDEAAAEAYTTKPHLAEANNESLYLEFLQKLKTYRENKEV